MVGLPDRADGGGLAASRRVTCSRPAWTSLPRPARKTTSNLWKRWPDFFHNLGNSLVISLGATALTLVLSFAGRLCLFEARRQAADGVGVLHDRGAPAAADRHHAAAVPGRQLAAAQRHPHRPDPALLRRSSSRLGTWIMKAFIDQLPRELEEAAVIDGASLARPCGWWYCPCRMPAHDRRLASSSWSLPGTTSFSPSSSPRRRRQDRTTGDLGDDRRGRRCRLGVLFAAATLQLAADSRVCLAGAKIPDRRLGGRYRERLGRLEWQRSTSHTPRMATHACRASIRCRGSSTSTTSTRA